jgi:V8-like Glu-specific endopeptidase
MKTMSVFTSLIFLTACSYKPQFSKAFDYGVVYGDDNRSNTALDEVLTHNPELSQEEALMLLEMGRATAGMVELGKHVKKKNDGSMVPMKELGTLMEKRELCAGENFENEYVLPVCSGFLVGPDLLVTAGHCVDREDYKDKVWLFGYDSSFAFDPNPTFSPDHVYFTKEVVLWEKNTYSHKDYALVRLDRKVLGVKPFKIRTTGKAEKGTLLAIIGHPSGLTTKISSGGAKILDASEENRLKTNVDSFAGNSGSPVINIKTGKVEGILVSGAEDYVSGDNEDDFCEKVNARDEKEGEEYITRISLVASSIL